MFWLNQSRRWARKLKGLSSLVIPVMGGYWLYTYAFNRTGLVVLLVVMGALILGWRMDLGWHRQRRGRVATSSVLSLKPIAQPYPRMVSPARARQVAESVTPKAMGGWD
jgi:hypothetical protein